MDQLREWLQAQHGRKAALAKHIGRTGVAIKLWSRVPSDLVLLVEEFTGIPRHVLRPDIYPDLSQGNVEERARREATRVQVLENIGLIVKLSKQGCSEELIYEALSFGREGADAAT